MKSFGLEFFFYKEKFQSIQKTRKEYRSLQIDDKKYLSEIEKFQPAQDRFNKHNKTIIINRSF